MAFFPRAAAPAASRGVATHLTYRLGGQLYGVPVDMVFEVAPIAPIAPLHTADPAVVGEIELRQSALVVVDMGLRLRGAPVDPAARRCLLVVKRAAARSGCLIGAAEGLARIPAAEIEYAGCLVEAAEAALALNPEAVREPEDASLRGARHGLPLYRAGEETILLPDREAYFPQ